MTCISNEMPRSSSSLAAFCIFSLSDSEPITMPTSGASSPWPNSAAAACVSVAGSRCVTLFPLHRAERDVAPHLLAVEVDLVRRLVRLAARLGCRLSQPGHVQYPAARGYELLALERGAGVEYLGVQRVDRAQAVDHVTLR